MRITFLTPPPDLSGGIRVVAQHARWLSTRGHEVRIAHPRGRAFGGRGLRSWWEDAKGLMRPPDRTHFDELEVERVLLPRGRPPSNDDLPDADVVIATWWETAEWMSALSPRKGAQVYFVQHHEVFDYLPKDRVRATYRLPVAMITISDWLRELLLDQYNAHDVSMARNGVDLGHFHAPARGRQQAPTVGMMYSAATWKGSDIAIAAAEYAHEKLPDLRVVAFGADPVPGRALPLPLFAEYFPRPRQRLLPSLYARCDAWLFPSRSEGFGLPILEAMSCRTPVIAAPAGAGPELVRAGGGILVPAEDPQAMADAIVDLCCCPNHVWAARSELAWKTAQAHSWEHAHQAFERALLRVVARRETTELAAAE
jgi:glycosyltransferase involved in cell wall biosynthesis